MTGPTRRSVRRTRADRDAITVEIGYALASAAFAAALVFGAVAGPALAFTLPTALEGGLRVVGTAAAAVVFVLRVVTVLWRFARTAPATPVREPDRPGRRGFTRPDS
ncbi:DUF6332 family protein [Streptomyces sp. HNM0663]|uniref:DUF6332 family protein n=1 Tax=Streptomyces chengmaiensis TaxID=3040919 RepID=A0ABT6HJW6_9ACTN|nr:DUF6332 family protein [Streptomyces chengmaiensis]MDH2388911.1 DUF6332 family protein [Streptomyces chengmaiensis]